ncbi:MAG: hypothetical protein AB7S55_08480 [Thiomonas sp.]|jgi:hypothetical protein
MNTDTAIIHVRFAVDGSVTEISERPSTLSAQDWFNLLTQSCIDRYEALSGGRGVFRIARQQLEQLKPAAG